MTLVLVDCLSWARVMPPPPNRGALMQLRDLEHLEKLVGSESIKTFISLVNDIFNLQSDEANRQHV